MLVPRFFTETETKGEGKCSTGTHLNKILTAFGMLKSSHIRGFERNDVKKTGQKFIKRIFSGAYQKSIYAGFTK